MSLSTQDALLATAMDMGSSDEDVELLDTEPENTPQVTRKAKLQMRKRGSATLSSTQPDPKRSRSVSFGGDEDSLPPEDECPRGLKLMFAKLQRDLTKVRKVMEADLPKIKQSLEDLKGEVQEIRAKVVAVAPPINLENELNQLSQKVDKVSQHLDTSSAVVSVARDTSPGVKLQDVLDAESKLKSRKMKFFDFWSYSERHVIYSSWESLETPFILSKYLPTLIDNEPPEEYEARRKKAENNRVCDMELLTLRSQRAKAAVDHIDAEVAQIISDSSHPPPVKERLTEEWSKMIKAEEEKSKTIWEKTAKSLRDSPRREAETQKVVEVEGKTYASVVRKPKPGSKKPGEKPPNQPTRQTPRSENSNWTTANGKNKRSHSEVNQNKNTPNPSEKSNKTPSTFQKKGPKFKPKPRGGWYQNQWPPMNYRGPPGQWRW